MAKGVRKTKSRFGGRLEPPSHVDLLLYEGRELDIVSQAETVDHFRAVRDDLDRLGRAVSMLETADQLALERQPNARLYDMLVGALRALAQQDAPLVVAGFFLKVLALEGFGPQVESCVVCGSPGPLVSWAIEEGGLRCSRAPAGTGGEPGGGRGAPDRYSAAGWGPRSTRPGRRWCRRWNSWRRGRWSTSWSGGCARSPLSTAPEPGDGGSGREGQSAFHSLAAASQPSHWPRSADHTMYVPRAGSHCGL